MPRRDQTALISQLNRYLFLLNSENLPLNGICFGLSVCRSAMRISGKLEWWDAAIDQILLWDGQKDSLLKGIVLESANSLQRVPLEMLFERIINYLVFNHGIYVPLPLSQYHLLTPGKFFSLVNGNNEIHQIEETYRIAGSFFTNDLISIFEDANTIEAIKNSICIVNNMAHACELGWLNGRFYFYDPEYGKGTHKFFETSKELVEEIFSRLGKEICIQLASLTKLKNKPFKTFEELVTQHTERLTSQKGFLTIAKWHTSLIPQLLENLSQDEISPRLNQTDTYGWSALMFAAYNNVPEAAHALYAAGANLNQTLPKNGWTPLIIASRNNASDTIRQLHADGADLNQKDLNDETALIHAVNCNATAAVKTLCEFNLNVLQRYKGATALHIAITLKDTEIFSLLLRKVGNLPPEIFSELHKTATFLKKAAVISLLESQKTQSDPKNYAPTLFKANKSEPEEQSLPIKDEQRNIGAL